MPNLNNLKKSKAKDKHGRFRFRQRVSASSPPCDHGAAKTPMRGLVMLADQHQTACRPRAPRKDAEHTPNKKKKEEKEKGRGKKKKERRRSKKAMMKKKKKN